MFRVHLLPQSPTLKEEAFGGPCGRSYTLRCLAKAETYLPIERKPFRPYAKSGREWSSLYL